MRTDVRYNPPIASEHFPRPTATAATEATGAALHAHRSNLLLQAGHGLTRVYNKVHDPGENGVGIVKLRELHVDLDLSVRDSYGWSDIELEHHHWETAQGVRFTVSPTAKDELLDRLLELNHQRYAEEVAAAARQEVEEGAGEAGEGRR